MRLLPGSSFGSIRKKLTDFFARPNRAGLGNLEDGTAWQIIRPGFNIVNQAAEGANSNYPMAAINFPQDDVSISLYDIAQGGSAALWISDADNWWAVGIAQEPEICNCQTGFNCAAYNNDSRTLYCTGAAYNAYVCVSEAWNAQRCVFNNYNSGQPPTAWTTVNGGPTAWTTVNSTCRTTAFNACTQWNTRSCQGTYNARYCIDWVGGNCATWNSANCAVFAGGQCLGWTGGNARAWNATNCTLWIGGGCIQNNSANCAQSNQANCRGFSGGTCRSWAGGQCSRWNSTSCSSWGGGGCRSWGRNSATCNRWFRGLCNSWSSGNTFCTGFAPTFCQGWSGGNCASTFPTNCSAYNATSCTGGWNATGCIRWNSTSCAQFASPNCVAFAGGNASGWNATACQAFAPTGCTVYNQSFCSSSNVTSCGTFVGGNCTAFNAGNCTAGNQTSFCAAFNTAFTSPTAWSSTQPPTAWTAQTACCGGNTCDAQNFSISAWNQSTLIGCQEFSIDSGTCAAFAYNAESCREFTAFTFGCQTCYPQYIRIMQSVAGTVTEVFKWKMSDIIRSLKIRTKKNELTISGYSDAALQTKVGTDIVYTPTGVTVQPKFGITIQPSSNNQGYKIDGVEFERN